MTFEVEAWMQSRGWTPADFQRRAWQAYLAGHSGLIHAPTGTGKSYSIWLGIVEEGLCERQAMSAANVDTAPADVVAIVQPKRKRTLRRPQPPLAAPLRALWITPMRALANDLVAGLQKPIEELGLNWEIGLRTGDATAAMRRRQRERMPTALVTTPESLSLLLSYPEARTWFADLKVVVVDEWHELIGTKRGVQTELGLARLRRFNPSVRTWGLSATLGNLDEARDVLLGSRAGEGVVVHGAQPKQIDIVTVLPDTMERFPWAGHLGKKMLPKVVDAIASATSTLVFTNTRSHAEIWFREILHARPDWAAEIALHHGSLDRGLREYVERRTREGTMKCVVCTSSLDLGVDFSPVDQVIQIGSPKGIARLLQRAGRSGHRPGAASRVLCVPTHAFELVEYAAVRDAATARSLEGRNPIDKPLDLLAQHAVTLALGEGFDPHELFDEVCTTYSFRNLTDDDWQWTLDFVRRGGPALNAYPQYAKLDVADDRFTVRSPQTARLHRMAIGTITSDAAVTIRFLKGARLGTIEESFVAKLKPGDKFDFAGRTLEFVRFRDLTAYVRRAAKSSGTVPRWLGGRLPLSSELASAVRRTLGELAEHRDVGPETAKIRTVLDIQAAWSCVPNERQLLIETSKIRGGYQCFIYPFEGFLVNEGLAMLMANRLARHEARTFTITANDYGFELFSPQPLDFSAERWRELLSVEHLLADLAGCVNADELAKRRFRDIARIAGLIFSGYPGAPTTARQLQVSSGLLFDVFREYDPRNLLLDQARREVLEQQLEAGRLARALRRIADSELVVRPIARLTPLAFPLWAARLQKTQVSNESWTARVQRMALQLEKVAEPRRPARTRLPAIAPPSPVSPPTEPVHAAT